MDEKVGVSSAKRGQSVTIGITVCSLAYLWLNSSLDFYSWTLKAKDNKMFTDKGPINYAPLYLMYIVIISTEIQYTVSTYNVGQRFVRLNNRLKNLLDRSFDRGRANDYFGKCAVESGKNPLESCRAFSSNTLFNPVLRRFRCNFLPFFFPLCSNNVQPTAVLGIKRRALRRTASTSWTIIETLATGS